MIYTVTFNPALDYTLGVEKFTSGMTNRSDSEQLLPGGKGLNVSTILNNLGIPNIALGFIAGFAGSEIKRRFEYSGGKTDFTELEHGESRINVKIRSDSETEINTSGPLIDKASLNELILKINKLQAGDILVLSGSIPPSVPDSIYSDIMRMLADRGVIIAIDATKQLLLNVLPCRPFLIKPNNHELGEIFKVTIDTLDGAVPYAQKLKKEGARNVLVSMADKGAVLVAENGCILTSRSPTGDVKSAVGAGDSMVAGFIAGWQETRSYEHAFKMGLAAGSATAFSERLATKQEIERVYKSFMLSSPS